MACRASQTIVEEVRLDLWLASSFNAKDQPLYFSGAMVYPFMFNTYPELKKLKEVAHIIAHHNGWRVFLIWISLQEIMCLCTWPAFDDDAYVDFALVQETLETVGNCKLFETSIMCHDAVRSKTVDVVRELFALRDNVVY